MSGRMFGNLSIVVGKHLLYIFTFKAKSEDLPCPENDGSHVHGYEFNS